MKDMVPLGTGNSRTLKSGIDSNMTWEQFRAALVAGTLPIDLGTVNPAGVAQVGDPLSKANLLPDDVAAALGLTGNPQVKDALAMLKADINGIELLYEKIRDIPDSSGTTSLSISIADIDWSEWRSIRLVCEVKCASTINVRINSLSDNNYRTALISPGSTSLDSATTTQACQVGSLNGSTPSWARLDLELEHSIDSKRPFFRFNMVQVGYSVFSVGCANFNSYIDSLSTLNLVATTSSHVVYLQNTSLWGVKR